jgi:hypothetical protein
MLPPACWAVGSLERMLSPSLTLIGKPGCHLCDEAREVVAQVVGSLAVDGVAVEVQERSILDDADLDARWHDDIPVVLVGTALHDRWRVDAERLRADLLAAAGG